MTQQKENELIDLKVSNDLVFQKIFGKVGNEDITKGLLEAILKIKIKSLSLDKNKRMQLDTLENKIGRLDVKAELSDGTIVHIEMQATEYDFMEKRIAYYNDVLYVEKLQKGKNYDNLKKVITILITNYNLECTKNISKYHTIWNFREKDYPNEILTYDKEIHIIELNKFDKDKETGEEADWIKFIKVKERKDMEEMDIIDETIKKAKEELEFLAGDPVMQAEYRERQIELIDTISFLSYQKRKGLKEGREKGLKEGRKKGLREGLKEGRQEGLKEGRQEGLKEGRQEGLKEGRQEGLEEGRKIEKIEIAKNMLEMDIEITKIIKATGLTEEEVNNIKID